VSAPTVVNYFGGKQEILLALLKQPDEQAMREARANLDDDSDPLDALCEFEGLMTRYQLQAMPASLWRELAPFLFTGELAHALDPWNAAVIEETKALAQHFQRSARSANQSISRSRPRCSTSMRMWRSFAWPLKRCRIREAHALHMRSVLRLLCHGMLVS
jgi:AcrR family transcriptional regulator